MSSYLKLFLKLGYKALFGNGARAPPLLRNPRKRQKSSLVNSCLKDSGVLLVRSKVIMLKEFV